MFEAVFSNERHQGLNGQDKIEEAERQLVAISDTAKIVSGVSSTTVPHTHFDIGIHLSIYLERKSAEITQGIQSHLDLGENTHVSIDSALLERILDTLLDNAQKYANDAEPIVFRAASTAHEVMLSVANSTALPLPANVIESPFTHGESSLNESVQGIGLSLYADKLILDSIGGMIDITSENGQASTTVTLPRLTKY